MYIIKLLGYKDYFFTHFRDFPSPKLKVEALKGQLIDRVHVVFIKRVPFKELQTCWGDAGCVIYRVDALGIWYHDKDATYAGEKYLQIFREQLIPWSNIRCIEFYKAT